MTTRDIIVVGASAGGVDALITLVSGLPKDLPAAVFVVLHFPAHSPSALPQILSRSGKLEAVHARNGAPIQKGLITVAPPDNHLLIEPGHVHLERGPKENGHRPAIDPLFRTAALAYGPRVIGVILTGLLDDGTAGLLSVKRRGGVAVVQDPRDALFSGMPESALAYVSVDHMRPVADIAHLLVSLTESPAPKEISIATDPIDVIESGLSSMNPAILQAPDKIGTPAPMSCPDCGGVLNEIRDYGLLRFRCQVGHGFSPESVLSSQADMVDRTLWRAFSALDERITLMQRLLHEARSRADHTAIRRFDAQVGEVEEQKARLWRVLETRSEAAAGPDALVTDHPAGHIDED